MLKKILTFIALGLMTAFVVFYFFEYNYQERKKAEELRRLFSTQSPSETGEPRCLTEADAVNVLDGTLQGIKDDVLYIVPKAETNLKSIYLTQETKFLEMRLTKDSKVTSQKQINREDLKAEDSLSVIFFSNNEEPNKCIATAVRRMILLE